MKRINIIIFGLLITIGILLFLLLRENPDEDVTNKEQEKETIEETIEQKAYRVETTKREAPKQYDAASREIWDIEEELRVAQAKIRRAAGKDGKKFVDDWRAYKGANHKLYQRISELRGMRQIESIEKGIIAKYGEDSEQHKMLHKIMSQKSQKKISPREFHQKLKKIE